LKIAQIIPHFHGIGGIQVCVHNISERLAKNGHEVFIFCRKDRSSKTFSYHKEVFHHFRYTPYLHHIGKWWMNNYIKRLQNKHQFDIWQINGGYPYGILLGDFFLSAKIPCVLRCSGEDIQMHRESNYGVRLHPKIDRLIKKNYRKFSAFVAITETVKQEYSKIGIPDKKIKVIPNGVDIHRIQTSSNSHDILKKHDIPKHAKVILSVGRNHPKKGYSLIPNILKNVLDSGVEAYWIVIGTGSRRLTGKNILGDRVDRLILVDALSIESGKYDIPSDELIAYYNSAHVFAMTSFIETFGIVLIEAMAAGLPVVCFNVPGVRDVMNSDCGTMCNAGNCDAFTDAIINILATDEKSNLHEHCRNYATRFSWDDIAEQYLELYKSLI